LNLKKSVVFDELFNPGVTKLEIIVTFSRITGAVKTSRLLKTYQENLLVES